MLLSVDATIYSVDNLESLDQRISRGPFTYMSPSPNGKSLALLTFSGLLWVVSTDFQRSLAEFNTSGVVGAEGDVLQVEWCGNDAVLVTWSHLAVLVGPFGDTLQYVLKATGSAASRPSNVYTLSAGTSILAQHSPSLSLTVSVLLDPTHAISCRKCPVRVAQCMSVYAC